MLPKYKFNIGKGLKTAYIKENNTLNGSFDTYQTLPVTEQMRISRMRSMVHTGNQDSSASSSSHSTGYLVSARYNRRRLSAISYNVQDTNNGLTDEQENGPTSELFDRRMSAPELPPIASGGKNSAIINNSNLTSRSGIFHNYKFGNKPRKSIHSDSSLQGITSRASSSSSQRSRQRVLSAGAERQLQTSSRGVITESVIRENRSTNEKIDNTKPTEVMPAPVAPAGRYAVAPGYKRSKSKISLNGYNSNLTTPRKIIHSNSETELNPQKLEALRKRSIGGMKRTNSENRLTDVSKRNVKNSQTGAPSVKKDTPVKSKGSTSNLNGLRKYSSTLGLNSNDKQSDESEQKKDTLDSDSDTEKDSRVIEWIIGVNEVAEPPEEQVIDYIDEPPQRDTAIRIVYDGDT